MARTIHILTQFLWPDDAPTGLYAEQLGDALAAHGFEVVLVGGSGAYRPGGRPPPRTPIVRLDHWQGPRKRLAAVALEYLTLHRAFARYLDRKVQAGDVVVITSAPPTTVTLYRRVRRRGAVGVYWLQDYYPQLVRGLLEPPGPVLRLLDRLWRRWLDRWDHVVKAAANLAYQGPNAVVLRNWNTLEPGPSRPAFPRTALYSGNLGFGHHLGAFVALCERLRGEGYQITVRGDGPGMGRLPAWIRSEAPVRDPAELVASYWAAEVHLVAADPALTGAIFPSKLWNSLAVGRPVLASGFAGPMAEELEAARRCDVSRHLGDWVQFLAGVARSGAPDPSLPVHDS